MKIDSYLNKIRRFLVVLTINASADFFKNRYMKKIVKTIPANFRQG